MQRDNVKRLKGGLYTVEENERKKKQALELYKQGYSVKIIARYLDLAKSTIYKWLKNNGVSAIRNKKYSKGLVDEIEKMYPCMTRKEMAEILGLGYMEILYIINYYGIRKNEERTKDNEE